MEKQRCKDCDYFSIFQGKCDGKCSRCHGTGKDTSWASGIVTAIAGEAEKCYKCRGTGTCPTCGGKGLR